MLSRDLEEGGRSKPRVIIYSGKGGTGKTTVSSSTAVALARQNKRVLIMSSDPAHSLSDVFNTTIGRNEPKMIEENLYGLEVDTIYELKKNMSGFQKFVSSSYKNQGIDSGMASELTTQPGLDEIFALGRLLDEAQSGRWDAVVLDTSPTGNTLRLLAYPEIIIGGNMGKQFFKLYKSMSSLARPMNKNAIPDEEFFNEVNVLLKQMEDINAFILSPEVTFRLVLNPEKLSILETKRAYTFVHLYGINIDGIVINKILPTSKTVGEYFEFWADLHSKYLMEIDNSFYPTPVFRCQLQRTEPIGPDALHEVSRLVFGDKEPDKTFYSGKNFWIESRKGADATEHREVLCIRIPFLKEVEDVEIERMGTDIVVTIDRAQRIITLPRALYSLEMENYVREDDLLKLNFREVPVDKEEMELNVNKNVLNKLRSLRKMKL
ncbi:ArsA family ATPase [Prosthecochloris sp. N3]|uniref:arsenite-transporting ATPase n=1 Tax=Prosthecochloris ethylica TaxID=2743976 RepID=A0ABR9XUW2_9CHLB|nr:MULTISPECIES: ArsA family ATPase [Prosthecochloris]MBF0587350.1 ArsA family ATPase [Prosthecochloris ethylica]MBF0637652.1 ArsA family ATPase [Prosthecochloris ethylica]NUK48664.1 ArsA family ATPase [Prosthecochloris ethylica]RNA64538.1 ArsA family ATPase [Prosthecochloris sp. ZM_2]